jgi:HK97 gp10 family phage protein
MGLEVTGLDEVIKKLRQMERNSESITDDALKVGGQILANEVKKNLSSQSVFNSSELQKAVKVSSTKLDGGGVKFVVVKAYSKKAWYGPIFEKGTSSRYTKPKPSKRYHNKAKYSGKIPGVHFMERALNSKENEIIQTIQEIITKELR